MSNNTIVPGHAVRLLMNILYKYMLTLSIVFDKYVV